MARFLLHRLVQAVLALLGISVLIFVLLHLDTASPAAAMLGKFATTKKIAQLDAQMGLNRPVAVQFILWLKAVLVHGGLVPVIKNALPPTLEMLGLGALVALCLAVIIAVLQVRYSGAFADRLLGALVTVLTAVPGFWLGSFLLFTFSITFTLFPATGFPNIPRGFSDWAMHEVLPVSTLALTTVGPWARHLRAAMEDSSATDYVRTARAKGAGEGRILMRHVFRNSILPLITLVGMSLPTMINTIIALEIIYAVPGAGSAFISSLDGLFFAGATTISLALAFVTVFGSVVADLAYGLVDPRVQYR